MFGFQQKITKYKQHRQISSDDIIVASFPKVGSTYTRFVFANLIHLYYGKEVVNFHNIHNVLPELYKPNFYEKWEYPEFPRIIKTHAKFHRSYANANEILYVIRDPRDTMLSYFAYASAKKSIKAPSDFVEFVQDGQFGIPALNKHLESYFSKHTALFKYEDLMLEPFDCFNGYLNAKLGLNISEDLILKAIELSASDKMKKVESEMGRPTNDNYDKNYKFIRNAKVEQWKSEMPIETSQMIMSLTSPIFKDIGYT